MLVEAPHYPQTAIITGAASGIGRATTERMAQDSRFCPVYALDINPIIHDVFSSEDYPRVLSIEADVRDNEQIFGAVYRALNDTGHIDVLLNIAGVVNRGRWDTYFDDSGVPTPEFVNLWETNLMGPLVFTHAVLPHMRDQGAGTIINVSSMKYAAPDPFSKGYALTKELLSQATQTIAAREREHGIRVVDVQPGPHKTSIDKGIWTPESDLLDKMAGQFVLCYFRDMFGSDPSQAAEVIHQIALGEIDQERVLIGLSAQLTVFMHEHFPLWEKLFKTSFDISLSNMKLVIAFSENETLLNLMRRVIPGYDIFTYRGLAELKPDWYLPKTRELVLPSE